MMKSKRKVMVFGTFDILHPGHIDFLRQAKRYGDFLIVSISRQRNAERIKKRKLVHSESDRKKMLQAVRFVDKVVVGSLHDYLGHIKSQRPDVLVLGYDQHEYTENLRQKLFAAGLKVRIIRAKGYRSKIYRSRQLLHDRI